MSEGVLSVVRSEMKSYIWLQTTDGSIQQVEKEVAMSCPVICQEILQKGLGSSKNYPIVLPERVNPALLGLILDYCRFHQAPGRSNKEHKTFDEKFIRMSTQRLCELTSAAYSLKLKPLVDLTCRALARIIEGKTPEEVRETFHIPDDLTEEEKLEPIRNITDDPHIRRLNRLYAKKRQELKERDKPRNTRVKEEHVDERSVDDLLLFINGGKDSKGVQTTKNKKKNRRRKEKEKDSASNHSDVCPLSLFEFNAAYDARSEDNVDHILSSTPSETAKLQDFVELELELDESDSDDGLDPAMKKELDREVENFARILNSNWLERRQEILSLGNERRLVPVSGNISGSISRFTNSKEGFV
ncbi:hypothetical protein SLEP1_g3456 [Rubroshorea leprosula]|uniref:SKP1-like protein 21 n=1 Tax=Rubroshorea leprosula TaxID=152421 RepID=A0AAV5HV19_9ROSI|nr:hypothetical protein SLEP1_g3456 [Rubroshorea leprosula]